MTRGRRRASAKRHIPPGVEKNGKNWVYRPYLGVVDGKKKYARRTVLCPITSPDHFLIQRYNEVTGKDHSYTVRWLMEEYVKSPHVQEKLGGRTRDDYAAYVDIISRYPTKDGRSLGEQPLRAIKPTTIRAYLDKYTDRNGRHAPVAADRHVQFFKAAWNYISERDDQVSRDNPCEGVRLNGTGTRDRYVKDKELKRYIKLANSGHQPSMLPLAMEIAYLCRLRANEVYALKKKHIKKGGLKVRRGKGSKSEITRWTPRLRDAVNACLDFNADVESDWLIHNKLGNPITMSNHKSQWQRLKAKAEVKGWKTFTFHDLKAKGYTDQKNQDAGHKSKKMHAVYDRRGRLVDPADGELPLK